MDGEASPDPGASLSELADSLDTRALSTLERLRRRLLGVQVPRLGGRYELRELLGSGGMGLVMEARDHHSDRVVAIKLSRASRGRGHDALRREARVLARIDHPHVVRMLGMGCVDDPDLLGLPVGVVTERGAIYLVLEYVDGISMRQWLDSEPGWAAILRVFVAAGRGLAAAHGAGVVHCDFKPANVLIGAEGSVKLIDFGAALELAARARRPAAVGTPRYMSPEQLRSGAVDARSDQFALCVALYEAVHRVNPYPGSFATMRRAKATGSAPPRSLPRSVPPPLGDILRRGTQPQVERRFPTMTALVDALEGLPTSPR